MKTTKKLIMATLMLVIAFVAVVSSTYAWFTSRQEAVVNNLELQAATEGTDLQISLTGNPGDYGYAVTLDSTLAQLIPVTYDAKDKKFYVLDIDTTENNRFKYVEKDPFAPGDEKDEDEKVIEGFLAFDLYFKTSSHEDVALKLSTSNIFTAAVADNPILGTLRIMFAPVNGTTIDFADAIIYEHLKGEDSTFGTGEYYNHTNNYIAFNAFTHPDFPFLDKHIDSGVLVKYILNDTFFAERKYSTVVGDPDDDYKVTLAIDLEASSPKHYKVYIWLEGWDGDTNNTAALQKFTTYLKFTN